MTRLSRRPQDVAAARAFLIAARGRTNDTLPTYGLLADVYGGIARGAAPVLNSIAQECREQGEPDLSVLVVDAASQLPGSFGGEPVIAGEDSERRWRSELAAVRAFPWPKPQTVKESQ